MERGNREVYGKTKEILSVMFGGIAKEIKNDQGVKFGIGMIGVLCGAYLYIRLLKRTLAATP